VRLLLILLLAFPTYARTRAVASRIDAAQRILVITAHPDDEILIAPLLANRCVRGGASCAIVVMTANELRAAEMARSAALLNLRLTQWSFSDVQNAVGETWAAEAGDRFALVRRISDVIAAEKPDLILTFDPRHGTTCHPAHRELGQLVLETGAKNIFLIETAAQFIGDGFVLSNAAPAQAWVYVANADWQYVVRVAEIHASQFSAERVKSLSMLPPEQRRVWFAPQPVQSAPCFSPIAISTIR
jgi:LmbE family N-acetylglucosaminyl deacetylase